LEKAKSRLLKERNKNKRHTKHLNKRTFKMNKKQKDYMNDILNKTIGCFMFMGNLILFGFFFAVSLKTNYFYVTSFFLMILAMNIITFAGAYLRLFEKKQGGQKC